jgi:hypothetical protein
MKKILLYLITMCTLISCSQKVIEDSKLEKRNEIYYIIGRNKPFTGKSFSGNSHVSYEQEYKKGKLQAIKQYRSDGTLRTHILYKENGYSEHKRYDNDGIHMMTVIFKDRVIQSIKRYDSDGVMIEERNYQN